MAGMTREQRRAMLADDEADVMKVDPVPVEAPVVPQAPVAGLTPEMLAMVQAMAQAIAQATNAQGNAVADAVKDARTPKPETYLTGGYHERSHYHPEGTDAPRPELRAEHWFAVYDPVTRQAKTTYPIADMLRDDEIAALNAMTPGRYTVERSDGSKVPAQVIEQRDASDEVFRVLIAFDSAVFDKEHKNSLPPIKRLAEQLRAA